MIRQKLIDLQNSGKYVFHGSKIGGLDNLVPRQATDTNPATGELFEDGDPAISASPFCDLAIFVALLPSTPPASVKKELNEYSQYGTLNGEPYMATIKKTYDRMIDPSNSGFVYVLERSSFSEYEKRGYEYRSMHSVQPVEVLRVTAADIPPSIIIRDLSEPLLTS
jgi:hypothetical protein